MRVFCSRCDNFVEATVREQLESYKVKGEKVDITSQVTFCSNCNESIFNEELDAENLESAYAVYRKNHGLLTPSEVERIRRKYGLSQKALAILLEWGEVTITRYENGSIQDPAHNTVLLFIDDPKKMKEVFERNGYLLDNSAREKLGKRIEQLLNESINSSVWVTVEDWLSQKAFPDEFTGFSSFNFDKVRQMIIYIAERTGGVFKTKLLKLLFYSDFYFFKKYSISISGSVYVHLPLGPVPNNYDWIITAVKDEGGIDEQEVVLDNNCYGLEFKALVLSDKTVLNKDEIKVLDFVCDYFKDFTCRQIKDHSHQEKAYLDTNMRENISYNKFAKYLSLE